VNDLQTALFKPVIFLKKRWLVLFFLVILIINIFLLNNLCFEQMVSAAEKDLAISEDFSNERKSNERKNFDFSRYYSSKRMVPIYKVARNDKKISLTIDGAWGSAKTEDILELLSEYDIKISFFFAGRWLENNQSLAGKILAEGHEIYNHSYNHPHFNSLSREEIKLELSRTEDLITELRAKYLNKEQSPDENDSRLKRESDIMKIYREHIEENLDKELPIKLNMLISVQELNQIKKLEDVNALFEISNSYHLTNFYKINDLEHYNIKIDLFKNNEEQDRVPELNKEVFSNKQKTTAVENIKLFRPPYGEYNDLVVQTAREMDYYIIQWSLDSHDWMDPGKDYVISRIKNNVGSGDILLFHNNSPDIIEILSDLLPYLKNNFEIVQIEDLIYQDDYIIRSFDGLQYLIEDDADEN
jgi:peptidoglycan/xylan/chitin deacetylase (PgdA/CDA1 family)